MGTWAGQDLIDIDDDTTIGDAFSRAAQAYGGQSFLAVPSGVHRAYHRSGFEITFGEAHRQVEALKALYRANGFGHGHRVAMLLDNRPEHYLHKLALTSLGVCCVPVNPDYRAGEIAYLLDHSEVDLALVAGDRFTQMEAALATSTHRCPIAIFDAPEVLLQATTPFRDAPVTSDTDASILYTSGTTGRPKGCILSHGYELASGAWYAKLGGVAAFQPGDRIYNPLPVYHVNASIVSFYAAMLGGYCQIQPDRFAPSRWWPEIVETRATVVHYLGIIVPLLLNRDVDATEKAHRVRFGLGAGVEPTLHAAFEKRFGFPLVEIWGMTEMVRLLGDNISPRQVGTRAFGRPVPGIDVRVVDENDVEVPRASPGEMTLRYSADSPRKHFFSGYLKDEAATEQAWRGDWFHTGDTVRQNADGMLHFVDRKKNIIRRSGENIAAAEVEAALQAHPLVAQVAVLAVHDDLREEEVFACVVLADGAQSRGAAEVLFAHAMEQLAYFKAPGWWLFVDTLPTTGTQKIQKHRIFHKGVDPRALVGVLDFRARKKRG